MGSVALLKSPFCKMTVSSDSWGLALGAAAVLTVCLEDGNSEPLQRDRQDLLRLDPASLFRRHSCLFTPQSSCPSSLVLGSAGGRAFPSCGDGKAQLYPLLCPALGCFLLLRAAFIKSSVESIFHLFSNGHQVQSLRIITRGFRKGL